MLTDLCSVLSVLLLPLLAVAAHHWFYGYWERHNIPSLQSQFSSSKQHLGVKFKQAYDTIKGEGWHHAGVFLQFSPLYVAADLNLVKNIMARDFSHFPHRGLYYNEDGDPLSCHIFNTSGTKWWNMRTNLNPIFTSSRLKLMFPLMLNCQNILLKRISTKEVVEVKQVIDSFVRDVIESCAFGLDWIDSDQESLFEQFARKIFNRSRTRRIKGFIVDNFPTLGKLFNFALIPKDASEFFLKVVHDAVDYRKRNNITRHDFIEVLASATNDDGTVFTVEQIAAQCFIFFLAAMSTSPTAVSFALYELSRNQDIQDKVRTEINTVLEGHKEDISYESIHEMTYLDQVLDETMRIYPPAAYLNRKCERNYRVLDSEVVIEKGTTVVIPVLGIHHDPTLHADPDKFDPERFNKMNNLKNEYAFMPFGAGPRSCIGMRFGKLQSKLALISLLKNFKFTVNEKTREPLCFRPEMLVLTAEGGIWLNVNRL